MTQQRTVNPRAEEVCKNPATSLWEWEANFLWRWELAKRFQSVCVAGKSYLEAIARGRLKRVQIKVRSTCLYTFISFRLAQPKFSKPLSEGSVAARRRSQMHLLASNILLQYQNRDRAISINSMAKLGLQSLGNSGFARIIRYLGAIMDGSTFRHSKMFALIVEITTSENKWIISFCPGGCLYLKWGVPDGAIYLRRKAFPVD